MTAAKDLARLKRQGEAWQQSEKGFQRAVKDLALLMGWKVFHDTVAWRSDPGWPDLVCVKGDRMVCLELKSSKGKATQAQLDWLAALDAVEGVSARLVKSEDWAEIEQLFGVTARLSPSVGSVDK